MEAPFSKRYRSVGEVQRRATKFISAIKDETYEDRLRYVNLTTLETRRLRGHIIEVFKIFKGFDDLDPGMCFDLSEVDSQWPSG